MAQDQIASRLADISHHESAHPTAILVGRHVFVMSPGSGFMLGVSLTFSDRIVREDDASGSRVKHACVECVPGVFIAAVTVHDNEGGAFDRGVGRMVNDRRYAHVELRAIGNAVGDDAMFDLEAAMIFRVQRRERIRNMEGLLDFFAQGRWVA